MGLSRVELSENKHGYRSDKEHSNPGEEYPIPSDPQAWIGNRIGVYRSLDPPGAFDENGRFGNRHLPGAATTRTPADAATDEATLPTCRFPIATAAEADLLAAALGAGAVSGLELVVGEDGQSVG